MMIRALRKRRRGDDGAAAVEFAFIAPILIFLLLAIVGYGYMLSFRQAMSQAASEGARAAAVAPPGLPQTDPNPATDTIQKRSVDAVNQGLGSYGVSCTTGGKLMWQGREAGTCVITFNAACSASTLVAKCAKVALDYTYKDDSLLPSFPGLGIVLPSHLTYTAEVEVS
jgi:Flp pilus assembly protein TadG